MLSTRYIVLCVFLFEAFAIGLALFLGSIEGDIRKHFKEGALITWISFFQILVISGISWKVFRLHDSKYSVRDWRSPYMVWAIVALAFLYLAVDEVAGIHEAVDKQIHMLFRIQETPLSDRLDDIIVGFYALLAIGILYYYREALKKYAGIFPYIVAGFVFLFVMVVFDVMTNRIDMLQNLTQNSAFTVTLLKWLSIGEETSKLLSEGMFLIAVTYCFQMAKEEERVGIHGAICDVKRHS